MQVPVFETGFELIGAEAKAIKKKMSETPMLPMRSRGMPLCGRPHCGKNHASKMTMSMATTKLSGLNFMQGVLKGSNQL
nr:hypothetical protein [Phnomibacter ginsenosidimutans]